MQRAGWLTRAQALAAVATGVALAPQALRAQTKPLRIGAATSDSYLIPYFAQEAGFFAKAGLSVEMTAFPNAQAIVQAAAGNAIDLGMADMIQLANAYNRGVPFRFFAGAGLYSTEAPTTLLCTAKVGGIKAPKDLEGQTLGVVALNSLSSISTTEWMRENNVDSAKVKVFELPFGAMVPAIQRGTLAATLISEPFITYGKDDLRVIAKPFDAIAKHFYIGAWFASRDWASANPEQLHAFTNAIYDAGRWANTHQAETLGMMGKVAKVDVERVRGMARVVWGTSLEARFMQPVLDIATKYGMIEKPVAANDLILKI
jgi:NitT/TauT family transport system substrate-binding protein